MGVKVLKRVKRRRLPISPRKSTAPVPGTQAMARQFEVVPDEPEQRPPEREATGTGLLLLALKSLSQRAVAGVQAMFTLFTVSGAWWLWYTTPDPTPNQIVSLSIFAV